MKLDGSDKVIILWLIIMDSVCIIKAIAIKDYFALAGWLSTLICLGIILWTNK